MNCTVKAAAVVVALIAAGGANGAQRTFVSVLGVDNPACSIAAPCRAFTAAVAATSPGGEVIVLDSGGYGPVTVAQSVSITAPPGVYAGVSVSMGDRVTVNAPGGTVRLAGLTINGLGGVTGINVIAASRVSIERCQVTNMTGTGISAAGTGFGLEIKDSFVAYNLNGFGMAGVGSALVVNSRFVSNTVDGVNVSNGFVYLRDVDASRGTRGAIASAADGVFATLEIEGGTFTDQLSAGVSASATGSGVARVDVTRATISAGLSAGIRAQTVGGSAQASIAATANTVSHTSTGLVAQGTNASIMATGNTVTRNAGGATGILGGTVYVGGDNSIKLNTTFDVDVGVVPYTRM